MHNIRESDDRNEKTLLPDGVAAQSFRAPSTLASLRSKVPSGT